MTLPAKILDAVREDVDHALSHLNLAVHKGVAQAEAVAAEEKRVIAAEVRAAVAAAQVKLAADVPEIEAALKKGAAEALAALDEALKARGL